MGCHLAAGSHPLHHHHHHALGSYRRQQAAQGGWGGSPSLGVPQNHIDVALRDVLSGHGGGGLETDLGIFSNLNDSMKNHLSSAPPAERSEPPPCTARHTESWTHQSLTHKHTPAPQP